MEAESRNRDEGKTISAVIPFAPHVYQTGRAFPDNARRAGSPPELGRIFASSPPARLHLESPKQGGGTRKKATVVSTMDTGWKPTLSSARQPLPLIPGGCGGGKSTHGKVQTQQPAGVAVDTGAVRVNCRQVRISRGLADWAGAG